MKKAIGGSTTSTEKLPDTEYFGDFAKDLLRITKETTDSRSLGKFLAKSCRSTSQYSFVELPIDFFIRFSLSTAKNLHVAKT